MNTFVLIAGDLIVFYAALFIALSLRAGDIVDIVFYKQHVIPFSILFGATILILYTAEMYDKNFRQSAANIFNTLLTAFFFIVLVAIAFFYFVPLSELTPKTNLIFFLTILFITLFFWHYYASRLFTLTQPSVLLVGNGYIPSGFEIVTVIPEDTSDNFILSAIRHSGIKQVLIDFTSERTEKLLPGLHTLLLAGVVFIDSSKLQEEELGVVDLSQVDESWFLQVSQRSNVRLFLILKRLLDICISLVLLPVFILLLPLLALAIKLEDGGPVFITQERLGKNRRVFTLYKFRSMNRSDDGVWHRGNTAVVTKVGAFLRKSRIDELPQLWNMLRGDMTLVGPRPDMLQLGRRLANEIPYYNARYTVRPGLTGWAQVSQEVIPQSVSESTERLSYDLYYIKHLSIFLELKIVAKTVRLLLVKIFS
jgi:lipopolysaccharide/colanic/teichoic acid biosynthesis glycosyltransferase